MELKASKSMISLFNERNKMNLVALIIPYFLSYQIQTLKDNAFGESSLAAPIRTTNPAVISTSLKTFRKYILKRAYKDAFLY